MSQLRYFSVREEEARESQKQVQEWAQKSSGESTLEDAIRTRQEWSRGPRNTSTKQCFAFPRGRRRIGLRGLRPARRDNDRS